MTGNPSALRSTVIVLAARLTAAALTIALGVVSAHAFGTSYQKDSFLVAQTLPSMLTTFVLAGLYSTLFVHLTAIHHREGARGMRRFLVRILVVLGLGLLPVLIAVEAVPALFVRVLAPGFTGEPAILAARLLRFTLVGAVTGLFVSACACLYQVRSRFAVPAIANLCSPLITLALLLAFSQSAGVYTLAIGPILGSSAGLLLLAALMTRAVPDPPGFDPPPHDPVEATRRVRAFWAVFLPMTLGGNVGQINILVDNAFASYLPSGSITMLGFAFVIVSNAQLLTTSTMGEVIFPRLASSVAARSTETRALFGTAMRHMLLVTAPIAFGAFSFATPLVRALFERGAFTPEATRGVAAILRAYAPGIVCLGFLTIFLMVLTTHERFLRVTATAAVIVVVNAGLDYVLMRRFGAVGIALGTSLTILVHVLVLGWAVRAILGGIVSSGDARFALKVFGGAGLMAGVVFLYAGVWERLVGATTTPARLAQAATGLVLGAGVYAGLLIALRVAEARALIGRIADRLAPGLVSARG